MDSKLRNEWNKWVNGIWTRDAPREVGRYALADYDGRRAGGELIVSLGKGGGPAYTIGRSTSKFPYELWAAWFWSIPTPMMPRAERL